MTEFWRQILCYEWRTFIALMNMYRYQDIVSPETPVASGNYTGIPTSPSLYVRVRSWLLQDQGGSSPQLYHGLSIHKKVAKTLLCDYEVVRKCCVLYYCVWLHALFIVCHLRLWLSADLTGRRYQTSRFSNNHSCFVFGKFWVWVLAWCRILRRFLALFSSRRTLGQ